MKFEPFRLCQYECTLIPFHSYRLWGAFNGAKGLALTLNRLRHGFSASVLFVEGEAFGTPHGTPALGVDSRYVVAHNGNIARVSERRATLLDISSHAEWDFAKTLKSTPAAGLFCLTSGSSLKSVKEVFELDVYGDTRGLGLLRHGLSSVIAAYVGFDHDAFFTLETKDPRLIRDALESTSLQGEVVPSLPLHPEGE